MLRDTGEAVKVTGHPTAPATFNSEMIETYFRYNSGAKEFVSMEGNK